MMRHMSDRESEFVRLEVADGVGTIRLDRPMKTSEDGFDQTIGSAGAPILVDCYADWCGPCRMMAPALDDFAQRYAGQVLVLLRDEQATAQVGEMARRKAYTARMFRTSTADFQKRTATEPDVAAQRDLADILALSGGVPIKVGDDTIGAVGSAGSNLEQDDACAKAGIAKAIGLVLRSSSTPPQGGM